MLQEFKNAIKKMIKAGEFEKIIAHAKGSEKRHVKALYNSLKIYGVDNIPAIVLLMEIKSASVLRDAICFMKKEG